MRQQTFSADCCETRHKKTRMDQVIPGQELSAAPSHKEPAGDLSGLSDPGVEEALYDIRAMRTFTQIDSSTG